MQELLASKRQGERTRIHPHYLKSTVACGLCGTNLGVTHSRGRRGIIYPYFFCYGRQKGNGCELPYIPLEHVEKLVETYWRKVQLPTDAIGQIREKVREHIRVMQTLNSKEVARQRKRLTKLEREERKLLQLAYAEAMSVQLIK